MTGLTTKVISLVLYVPGIPITNMESPTLLNSEFIQNNIFISKKWWYGRFINDIVSEGMAIIRNVIITILVLINRKSVMTMIYKLHSNYQTDVIKSHIIVPFSHY